ncbi:hypothetical protein ACI2L1_21750 [Streptomyces sp. NPDC019531]|uniref:hypothetical protein n=1 Tax=Streptomyces sp. NPDC019531 TaxID=3365062 RepID=UPI00384F1437
MTWTPAPRHLLVRAQGDDSPLYLADDEGDDDLSRFTRSVPPDDPVLGLTDSLADRLTSWSRARPGAGASRQNLRRHAKRGLEVAQALARYLGPQWVVRYWDDAYATDKFVCWGCRRLHWSLDEHDTPPYPLRITVEGEYKWHPLRAGGFGDFAPDDPTAGLDLSDELVADLYKWAADFNAGMEQYLNDRDDVRDDERRRELDLRGRDLAARVAREAGPARTVTYGGLA